MLGGVAPLHESLLSSFGRLAADEETQFFPIQDKATRYAVMDLITRGDRLQWAEQAFRQEVAAWVRHRNESRDGFAVSAQAKGNAAGAISPFIVRTAHVSYGEAVKDRQLGAGSPTLAVLATSTDTWIDWFSAGQAVEKILLRAYAEGVQASFVNQPIEVPSLRTALHGLIGHSGFPQLVLRIGYGQEVSATPRRSVSEVLLY